MITNVTMRNSVDIGYWDYQLVTKIGYWGYWGYCDYIANLIFWLDSTCDNYGILWLFCPDPEVVITSVIYYVYDAIRHITLGKASTVHPRLPFSLRLIEMCEYEKHMMMCNDDNSAMK